MTKAMTRSVCLGFGFASLVLATPASTQETKEERQFEEIVVIGHRPIANIRAELRLAENNVYSVFNALNDDDGYDIICKTYAMIGSQLRKRHCKARMLFVVTSSVAVGNEYAAGRTGVDLDEEQHTSVLQEKMAALARENPNLLAALQARLKLEQELGAARQQRLGTDHNRAE